MTTENTDKGQPPSKRTAKGIALWAMVRRVWFWPRNSTTRRGHHPWWKIVWRAPFVAASIVTVYAAAILCGLLTLAYQPTRAAEIFDRIRNA